MGYGWLSKRDLPPEVNGIPLDPDLTTRREEYTLVYETAKDLPPGLAVDVGCGYTPERHIAAPILASLDWAVRAIDSNPRVLEMPPHRFIAWQQKDFTTALTETPCYTLAVCISVLEHLSKEDQQKAAQNITDSVVDGGTLIVTADEMQPLDLTDLFPAFDFGQRVHCSGHLSPLVAFGVGKKQPRQPEPAICSLCFNPAVKVCTYAISLRVDFINTTCDLARCGNLLCESCRCHT
jgi:SAM-dependent methyltransferase